METQKMCEPKDFKHFIGAIGNLYVRANLSTPFDLAKYAKAWPDDGITPSHCIEQARLYLNRYAQYYRLGSGDSSLPILDRIIRKTWLELQYPQADGGSCDEKSRSESQASPVIEGNPEGPVKQWWEPKAPLRRASAQSAEDYAIAFLYRELAEGELSVRELKKGPPPRRLLIEPSIARGRRWGSCRAGPDLEKPPGIGCPCLSRVLRTRAR